MLALLSEFLGGYVYIIWAVSQAQNRLCRLRDGASGVKKALLPSCDGVDF
ncbi:hypothetical protein EV679_0469 [Kerstersia gyiorum]|uniref:Uncharacterized protein n=1 Tax=Kerstersia gyiorum TaxID=206506 RepID=A0A4Q7N149_9BURK|nr:hypothetical protein EV679_0469 [Kerstersia gyiorum]